MPHEAIILGDFNMQPDAHEYEMMIGSLKKKRHGSNTPDGFVDTWLAAGNDSENGVTDFGDNVRIDYVFVSNALADRVRAAHVDVIAQGSDHQPLWVDIDL